MRVLVAACCALLALPAWAQRAKPPAGNCSARPADCQVSMPLFDFGRAPMNASAPPVYGHNTISVTCTRSPADNGRNVDVTYELEAVPPDPARSIRNLEGDYLRYFMFLDPARTRYWGDGNNGTFTFQGGLFLDDRNRVGSLFHVVYGRVDGAQGQFRAGPGTGAVVSRLRYDVTCR
jgi:spore coat protein U-like protein